VLTAICLEPTIAAAHKMLSISELTDKRRPWSSDCTPRAAVHRASRRVLAASQQAACAESGPSRARDYWAGERLVGSEVEVRCSQHRKKWEEKQEVSESMMCRGIDPHSLVGGVLECRRIFSPSLLPITCKSDGVLTRSSIVEYPPLFHFSSRARLSSAPPRLDAQDLQRHDWLINSPQPSYNSPVVPVTVQSPTATATTTATRGADDMPIFC
jgi:hypothetical protein